MGRGDLVLGLASLALFLGVAVFGPVALIQDLSIYFCYAIFAASLALVWGQLGLLSLGHGVFFGIGAYAMSVVTLGMIPGAGGLHSTWAGLVAAVALGGGAGAGVGLLCFSGRGVKGAFLGIVTLAIAYIAERLAINSGFLGGMNGLMNVPPVNLGLDGDGPDLSGAKAVYGVALAALAAVLLGLQLALAGSWGALVNGARDNELRLWTLGADVRRLKIAAFSLSAAIAALAGALFVTQFGFASPTLIGPALSLDVLIWVAIGGRNSLVAASLGAIGVRFLESRLSDLMGDAWPLALGLVFIASVVAFPDGVFGSLVAAIDRSSRQGR